MVNELQGDAKPRHVICLYIGITIASQVVGSVPALADIVPDGLGTVVDAQDCLSSCTITEGSTRGTNLFHSFEEFSVPRNSIATFQHSEAIANIITRVTGGSVSRVNGTIQTLLDDATDDIGSADLFFINPSGIVFGGNAQLNIGGSFISSTAERLEFADGVELSVNDADPLLTISTPVGLQFGTDPGTIRVRGEGNNLFLNPDFTINRSDRPPGLSVTPGNTLALVGGAIKLNGGNLTAEAGRIELGAIADNSTVTLDETDTGWTTDDSNVDTFGNIQLVNAASADVSGDDAGALTLQGKNITLQDGTSLLANTLVSGGGLITLQATDSLQMSGTSATVPDAPFTPIPTSVYIEIAPEAVGDGSSELLVNTNQLDLEGGSQIGLSMGGLGVSGTVNINADTIIASGSAPTAFSGIFAAVLPVFSPTPATGLGGELIIRADDLQVLNGAQITASTFGFGNAGNLTINANTVKVMGFSFGGPSSLGANAEIPPAGSGGRLTINTDRLLVADGGQVATATVSITQPAGDLTIRATDSIELRGTAPLGRSGLFASALSLRNPDTGEVAEAAGEGGNITLETDRLIVTEGASVNVGNNPSNPDSPFSAPGNGPAGNMMITANTIVLSEQASLTADTVDGDRANINLDANLVFLSDSSQITTSATGIATGGNLGIDTRILAAFNNSDITANAVESQGGNIQIRAQNVFGIQPRDALTPFSDITASSESGLDGTIVIEAPDVDPEQGLVELSSEVVDVTRLIAQGCHQDDQFTYSQFSVAGRGGVPSHPTGLLNNRAILASPGRLLGNIGGNVDVGNVDVGNVDVGNVDVIPSAMRAIASTRIASPIVKSSQMEEASAWAVTVHGQVALVAESQPISPYPHLLGQPRTTCQDH